MIVVNPIGRQVEDAAKVNITCRCAGSITAPYSGGYSIPYGCACTAGQVAVEHIVHQGH